MSNNKEIQEYEISIERAYGNYDEYGEHTDEVVLSEEQLEELRGLFKTESKKVLEALRACLQAASKMGVGIHVRLGDSWNAFDPKYGWVKSDC